MTAKPREGEDQGGADAIMSSADLRPLLNVAKHKPVACAVALTRDKEAVLLLHRTMRPRKVLADLRKGAKAAHVELDLTTLRFGLATVDGASDSQRVNIRVNKPVPNTGAFELKLRERVKPAGFKRCSLGVDEKLNDEADDDEREDDAPVLGAAMDRAKLDGAKVDGATVDGAQPTVAAAGAARGDAERAPGPGTSTSEDAAELERRLSAAIRRIAASPHPDPDAEHARRQAARLGWDALRAGDLTRAEHITRKLEEVLATEPHHQPGSADAS